MRVSHPKSGMIVYLSQAEYDEFKVKPTDRFRVSAWIEGSTIWVKVHRGKYYHLMCPYKGGNPVTPWHVRGPSSKDNEGRFYSEIDVPEFGMTVPIGAIVEDDTMLIELCEVSTLNTPDNRNKKLGLTHSHSGKYGSNTQMPYTDQDEAPTVLLEGSTLSSLVDDGRMAIKAAVDLINQLVQEGGKFKFCINRDGVSHRLKKGDSIKAKVVTEEDL